MLRKADWLQVYLDLPSKQAAYRLMREGLVPGVVRVSPHRIRVNEAAVRAHFERTDEDPPGAAASEVGANSLA